jgi:secondary thiamine-phosphate synthase enzyme
MKIATTEERLETRGHTDIVDITERIENAVGRAAVISGQVLIFVPGSTGALTTIENEPGLLADFRAALERWASEDGHYQHDRAWGDGNGYAHVRASLIGPSLTVPIVGGKLALGTWQQIVFLDFDNRPRSRCLVVQVMGE